MAEHHPSAHDQLERLTSPPQLKDGNQTNSWSQVQWLETFFDLVFGIAITQLADSITARVAWGGVLRFSALLLPFWWIWMGNVVYGLRFGIDNLLYRWCTFGQVLAVIIMILSVPQIGAAGAMGFALAFFSARVLLLVMYWSAYRANPAARVVIRVYFRGFGLGACCWFVSLALPPPWRFALWGFGLLVDLLTPWIGRPVLQRLPLDAEHLPERLGVFVTIVLGQSLLSVVGGLGHVQWDATTVLVALLLFGVIIGLWWSYFGAYEMAHPSSRLGSGQPFIYAHLPYILGVALVSAAIAIIIPEAHANRIAFNALLLLFGGTELWVVGLWLIELVTLPPQRIGRFLRIVVIALICYPLVGVLGLFAAPLICVLALCLIFASLIAFKLRVDV